MALKPKFYFYIISLVLIIIVILLIQGTFTKNPDDVHLIKSKDISRQVNIYRNEYGIPYIVCDNYEDYFYSLGYIQAKDRLLQLELQRRIAKGELSEFLSMDYLKFDKFMRDINLRSIAHQNTFYLDSQSHKFLKKFIDGINKYITENKNSLPYELGLTNNSLKKFTINDILLLDELYKLQKNNIVKEKLFLLMSIINLGKSKTLRLVEDLKIKVDVDEVNDIATRKYTYGDLKYIYEIFSFIDMISIMQSSSIEPFYALKNSKSYLFSYTNISKTFLNYGEYCVSANINGKNQIAIYDIGNLTPNIVRRNNNYVFSTLRNNYDYFEIGLYDVNDKNSTYNNLQNSSHSKLQISIDTIQAPLNQKLIYSYSIDSNTKIVNYYEKLRKFVISIKPRTSQNNWISYYINKLLLKNDFKYQGNSKSYIEYKNDSLIKYDLHFSKSDSLFKISNRSRDTLNSITYYPNNFTSSLSNNTIIYNRLNELISDAHNFSLTDLKLISNDNKNVIASLYLNDIVSVLYTRKYSQKKDNLIGKLKKWDFLDDISSENSRNFKLIVDNFITHYLSTKYNVQTAKLIFSVPEYKDKLLSNLLENIKINVEIKKILIESFKQLKFPNSIQEEFKIPHILTYYTKKEIISLNLQNMQGGFNSLKYFYNYNNSNILNNTFLFFDIKSNSNSLMMNFGSSSDLESKWNMNLFELWTTGGTIESNFYSKNNKLIINISNEN